MYAVLAEDQSDFDTIKVFIKRISGVDNCTVKGKGYTGCSEMMIKGASHLNMLAALGVQKAIVCYDSDGHIVENRRKEIIDKVIYPAGLSASIKWNVVIPVQEIEAWLLADVESATQVFSGWRPKEVKNPEYIRSPKEYLENMSSMTNGKPRYSHATHNSKLAKHVRLDYLRKKCPSFESFYNFIAT